VEYVIRDKVLPTLTQLSFDAQHEKIGCRFVQAEIYLNALKEIDVPEDMEDGTADVDEDGDNPESSIELCFIHIYMFNKSIKLGLFRLLSSTNC
jgi:hypothetical protein